MDHQLVTRHNGNCAHFVSAIPQNVDKLVHRTGGDCELRAPGQIKLPTGYLFGHSVFWGATGTARKNALRSPLVRHLLKHQESDKHCDSNRRDTRAIRCVRSGTWE